jgi:hypothetical protein
MMRTSSQLLHWSNENLFAAGRIRQFAGGKDHDHGVAGSPQSCTKTEAPSGVGPVGENKKLRTANSRLTIFRRRGQMVKKRIPSLMKN